MPFATATAGCRRSSKPRERTSTQWAEGQALAYAQLAQVAFIFLSNREEIGFRDHEWEAQGVRVLQPD